MLKNLFRKREYVMVSSRTLNDDSHLPNIPNGKWINCPKCKNILYKEDLERNHKVCIGCGHHFNISAKKRIEQIFDENSFVEMFDDVKTGNPLNFEGYEDKLELNQVKSGLEEAVIAGTGEIKSLKVATAIMDSNFMMGSMGCAVGEKITRIVEYATENKLPLIIFTASGGARMQEGIFSLMQMAKTSLAISRHDNAGLLYISVITHPTTGGITASFAMEGDIIISEPNAVIGFAGRRVIENTINEKLPEDFQSAEFALEKGFIDSIVKRRDLKNYLNKVLRLHGVSENAK
ncbi:MULTISPECIES: acetyl-CoA carboxylase, carboxyltransferase subunit beta [Terrisporobacter]|uniref:Acetyl-coenzyme A carboxylase carboxyl transferase subunit beta n=1 Tax=Terrisporobacter muris TaxID=2963284 RepID=A0A9X2S075_9FIRM|nr:MULTISPECIES: acetyl-CoA carboxylase, carboxyltransferase subunit beta [Terrisporobacter]MCR1821505.1 acetyl-CoA carboxylase, carboxyltransferase subunit beta [Terrisporobacter muris]MDY3371730.1 acetyl-CoA carboxylase, carboxyltransferase subunit beta [Terrisporobacter othiniensis]